LEAGKKLEILATTFPIYQITRNVTNGCGNVEVRLMLPSQLGCPHDYALTPQDMQKLGRADVIVVNGFGMEEFLGAPIKRANSNIVIVDSSAGINETLDYADEGEHGDHHVHDAEDGQGDHGEDMHHHSGINPHLFASPRMVSKIAKNIACGLGKADPEEARTYLKNAEAYAEKMNSLAEEMAALGRRLRNNRVVEPHGIFDYLARDMGLDIVAVMQAHGQGPSASEMMDIVRIIREKKAGAILTEPQYPEKVGRTLAKESGIPAIMLDPVATGPDDAALDYYEKVMRQNMKMLEETLGVK
jgi:zinc/manganese transport system substrate-binding protein/zinc transport system substrate-binding protein